MVVKSEERIFSKIDICTDIMAERADFKVGCTTYDKKRRRMDGTESLTEEREDATPHRRRDAK